MLVVTGGAGFIGSNLVKQLNEQGHHNILVVDDLEDGTKFKNLVDCTLLDYMDKDKFLQCILDDNFSEDIEAIFHLGACSSTTEWNGKFMMENNYEYSKALLHYCEDRGLPFLYASSAATYGNGTTFAEDGGYEAPLNVYGYSKYLFDQYVRQTKLTTQVVGFRYFNVYGPREFHKGSMASVALHIHRQIKETGIGRLFEGCEGYADGEQRRDFVYVGDVCAANIWFWQARGPSGIYNIGTGKSQTFKEVAEAVIAWHGRGEIQYIPFPDHLKGRYQSFTEADITKLRQAGYDKPFKTVAEGVKAYLDWMQEHNIS